MIRRVFIAAVLTALLASLAYAQRGGGGGGRGGGGGQEGGGGGAGFGRGPQIEKSEAITKELKLTPDQKTALEAIMDEAQKQTAPVLAQITEQRNALLKLSVAGTDTGDVTRKLAELNAQTLAIEVDAFGKALAKLDDKQKSKAPKLFDMMAGMFGVPGGWRKSN
jgi:Spy/CpxP family protein refolding chaperone